MKKILLFSSFFIIVVLAGCHSIDNNKEIDSGSKQYNNNSMFDLDDKEYIGNKNAPNDIIIFQDYECKRCKEFNNDVMSKINKDVKEGRVKLYIYDLAIVNENSYIKAMIGAVFEEKYPLYYKEYIQAMYKLSDEDNRQFSNETFVKSKMKQLFPDLKLDSDISKVFNEDIKIVNKLNDSKKVAKENKVNMVPAVFLNEERVKNMFYINDIRSKYLQKGDAL